MPKVEGQVWKQIKLCLMVLSDVSDGIGCGSCWANTNACLMEATSLKVKSIIGWTQLWQPPLPLAVYCVGVSSSPPLLQYHYPSACEESTVTFPSSPATSFTPFYLLITALSSPFLSTPAQYS